MQQPVKCLQHTEKALTGKPIIVNTADHRCPAAADLGKHSRPLLSHLPLPMTGKIHRLRPAIRLCHGNRANVAFISPGEEHRKAVVQQRELSPDPADLKPGRQRS